MFFRLNEKKEEPPDALPSLLDLRTDGWVLEQSWPGLFDLYTRDGEARAHLSPELSAIEAAHLQGYSVEDKAVANVKGALALSAVLYQAMREVGTEVPVEVEAKVCTNWGEK